MIEVAPFEKLRQFPLTLSQVLNSPPGNSKFSSRSNIPRSWTSAELSAWFCISGIQTYISEAICVTGMGLIFAVLWSRLLR